MVWRVVYKWLYRFSQPIVKDTHQWAPAAYSVRQHRAYAVPVWERTTLRQGGLEGPQRAGRAHHLRDT